MNLFSKIKNWFKEFFKGWKPIPLSEVHSYKDKQDINPATGLLKNWGFIPLSEVHSYEVHSYKDDQDINPATGLPMVGGFDTSGNPYGSGEHQ